MFGSYDDFPMADLTPHSKPGVGVGVIVFHENGKILLGKRKSTFGKGFYSFPGGKLEHGERLVDCVARELKEETGLEISYPELVGFTEDFHKEGQHYITMYFAGDHVGGILTNPEPDKTEDWQWYNPNELPEPLWEPLREFFKKYSI